MKRKQKCIEKRSYYTLQTAKDATLSVFAKYKQRLNVYECPMCLDFHLTKGKTKLGCLLDRTDIQTQKRIHIHFQKKDKPKLVIVKSGKVKKPKIYKGRMPTIDIINMNYAAMRRHLKGLGITQLKRKSTLKGTLPLEQQKLLLATLNS